MSKGMLRGALAALLPVLVAAGCKVGPDYAPPAVPVAERWSMEYPAFIDVNHPVDVLWWQSFGDRALSELVERVRFQNLTLQEADARIGEARARLGIARGGLWPVVFQTDSFTHRQFSENGTPFGPIPFATAAFDLWSLGFDAAWELDVAGKSRRGIESAEAELEGTLEDRNDVLVSLIGETARTYVELRAAQERVGVARENARLQQETVRLTEERLRCGAVSPLDVSQAKTQLAQTQSAIPEFVNQVKLAENRLCILQGEPPRNLEAEWPGHGGIPRPPLKIAVGLPLELLRQRPDVRRMERDVAARSAQIGVAAADLYPQLSLVGTFTLDASKLSSVFLGDSLFYSTGPSVRWNILNFGRIRNNIRTQEARFEQSVAHYRETVLEAAAEVDSAISTLVRQQEREQRLAEAVESARESVRVAQQQYLEGAVGFQSLLDAQRVQVQVQDQHVAARGSVAVAAIALYKSLGGGWETHSHAAVLSEDQQAVSPEELPPPSAVTPGPADQSRAD